MNTVSKESIRDVYAVTARRYDMILRIYKILGVNLKKWRDDAFGGLPPIKKPRILDVAVGTGTNLPYLIEKYPDYEEIVGIDYTPEMLGRAKKRIRENDWRNITISRVDAGVMSQVLSGKFDLIIWKERLHRIFHNNNTALFHYCPLPTRFVLFTERR